MNINIFYQQLSLLVFLRSQSQSLTSQVSNKKKREKERDIHNSSNEIINKQINIKTHNKLTNYNLNWNKISRSKRLNRLDCNLHHLFKKKRKSLLHTERKRERERERERERTEREGEGEMHHNPSQLRVKGPGIRFLCDCNRDNHV